MTRFFICTMLAVSLSFASSVLAEKSVLEISEKSVGKVVANYRLIDQQGQHIPFNTFRGKAVLLSFMYIDCPDMCITTNNSLGDFLDNISPELSENFVVVSISLDPTNDTPERLNEYSLDFSSNHKNWYFTTTDKGTLSRIVADLGFTYNDLGDGVMEHLGRLTLINSKGVVVHHIYGAEFGLSELEGSVRELVEGRDISDRLAGVLFNEVLAYCSIYDPDSKTYKLDKGLIFAAFANWMLVMATAVYFARNKIKSLYLKVKSLLGK